MVYEFIPTILIAIVLLALDLVSDESKDEQDIEDILSKLEI